jgi:hypothetical protein
MRIVQEILDKEDYLEICISPRELEMLEEYMIISKKCLLNGTVTNIGVKLGLEIGEDEED